MHVGDDDVRIMMCGDDACVLCEWMVVMHNELNLKQEKHIKNNNKSTVKAQ